MTCPCCQGAAKCFFGQTRVVGHRPEKVTTDGLAAYPRAIRETLGTDMVHRCRRYMNNRLEQDHRGIKQRYVPLRGFGSFAAAARCCAAHDELRDHLRSRHRMNQTRPWPTSGGASTSGGTRCGRSCRRRSSDRIWEGTSCCATRPICVPSPDTSLPITCAVL
jgi:hypothetical protein